MAHNPLTGKIPLDSGGLRKRMACLFALAITISACGGDTESEADLQFFQEAPVVLVSDLDPFGFRDGRGGEFVDSGIQGPQPVLVVLFENTSSVGQVPGSDPGLPTSEAVRAEFFGAGTIQPVLAAGSVRPTIASYMRNQSRGRLALEGHVVSVSASVDNGCSSNGEALWQAAIRGGLAGLSETQLMQFDVDSDGTLDRSELWIIAYNDCFNTSGIPITRSLSPTEYETPSGKTYTYTGRIVSGNARTNLRSWAHELIHVISDTEDLYVDGVRSRCGRVGTDECESLTLMASTAGTSGQPPVRDEAPFMGLDPCNKLAIGWIMPNVVDIAAIDDVDFVRMYEADWDLDAPDSILFTILTDSSRDDASEFFVVEARRGNGPGGHDSEIANVTSAGPGMGIWSCTLDNNGRIDAINLVSPAWVAQQTGIVSTNSNTQLWDYDIRIPLMWVDGSFTHTLWNSGFSEQLPPDAGLGDSNGTILEIRPAGG